MSSRESDVLRDVIAICRTVGRGEEDIDFEFCADVMKASPYPEWVFVGIACRLVVNLATAWPLASVDDILDQVLLQNDLHRSGD